MDQAGGEVSSCINVWATKLILCGLGKEEAHRVVWATEVTYNLTESDKKKGESGRKHTEYSGPLNLLHWTRQRERQGKSTQSILRSIIHHEKRGPWKSAVKQEMCYDSTPQNV